MFGMGAGRNTINMVNFDGTNDRLSRGSGLTGAADGKVGTVSFYIRVLGITGTDHILNSSFNRMSIDLTTSGIAIVGENAAGSEILNINTSALTENVLYHVMASWDLANTATHLYVNNIDDKTQTTATDDSIDYTVSNWGIGADPTGGEEFNGCLGHFYFNSAEYVDLSSAPNRSKFYIPGSTDPVNMGSDGSAPTGTAPIIFLNNPLATWHTNLGSGGGFTESGALTAC